MNIFLTGASGFVGKNFITYFNNSHKIRPYLRESNISISEEIVVHFAGKAHDLKKTSKPEDYYNINTKLTKNVFDSFLNSNAKVFIMLSSVKAVADVVNGVLTEDHFPNPKTDYGKSKLLAEKYISSKINIKNKRIYILRPCMIHGPGNKGNLNLLYRFVSKEFPYPFGKYENKRSFVSVENLCFIINELIDNTEIESGIYNIADDASLSSIELVQLISEVVNKPVRFLKIPKIFLGIIAKIGDFLPIPLNSERLQKLTENYEVSNLKIKNAIQKKLPLSSIEGIKKTITSF